MHQMHQISEADRQRANQLLIDHQVANIAKRQIATTIEDLERQRECLDVYARNKIKEVEELLLHPAYRQ